MPIHYKFSSWNPSIGCNKTSPGCKNCYASKMALNFQKRGVKLYKDGFKFKILPKRLSEPLSVKNPTMFFVNSMSDIFHEDMPFSFVDEIIKVII